MGCNISVALPPIPNQTDHWSRVGADIRWIRKYATVLYALGIPGLDDQGMFMEDRGQSDIAETLERIRLRVRAEEARLDDGTGDYDLWRYLQEWVHLYEMVVELSLRGVSAHLFGA